MTEEYQAFAMNLIKSVSVEKGGGTGFWCHQCGMLYQKQPAICENMYTRKILNKEKLRVLIHDLGEVSDEIIDQYIEDPKLSFPEITQILKDENQIHYEEESCRDYEPYETLIELILNRYRKEVFDSITSKCHGEKFIYETRKGEELAHHDYEVLNTIHEMEKTQVVYTPLQFQFDRENKVAFVVPKS